MELIRNTGALEWTLHQVSMDGLNQTHGCRPVICAGLSASSHVDIGGNTFCKHRRESVTHQSFVYFYGFTSKVNACKLSLIGLLCRNVNQMRMRATRKQVARTKSPICLLPASLLQSTPTPTKQQAGLNTTSMLILIWKCVSFDCYRNHT